jgi:hypothetical protein
MGVVQSRISMGVVHRVFRWALPNCVFRWALPIADIFRPYRAATRFGWLGGAFGVFRWAMCIAYFDGRCAIAYYDGRCPSLIYFALTGLRRALVGWGGFWLLWFAGGRLYSGTDLDGARVLLSTDESVRGDFFINEGNLESIFRLFFVRLRQICTFVFHD